MSEKKTATSTVTEVSWDDTKDHLEPMLQAEAQQTSTGATPVPWSMQGTALTQEPIWELYYDAYDSCLVAIAIVLLMKTSLCVYAYNIDKRNRGLELDAVSALTINLIYFNGQLVTAFTIIFVTIMTTVTRRYARYRVQRGANIVDLEQLHASISLPSTIKMVFSLRRFTKISLLLVLLWSFYYTGSQASKREYTLVFGNATRTLTGAYPRSNAAFVNFDPSTWPAGSPDDLLAAFKEGRSEKITSPGVDKHGNMLLPDPNNLPNLFRNGTVNDTTLSQIRPSKTYYMEVGRPLMIGRNHTEKDSTTEKEISYREWTSPIVKGDYEIQTSYIRVDCRSVEVLPATQFPSGVVDTLPHTLNVTELSGSANSSARQVQFWQRWGEGETMYGKPVRYLNVTLPAALRYTCDLFEPQIKVRVRCSETACLAVKMEFPHIDPSLLKTTPFSNSTFSTSFFDTMLLAEGVPKSRNQSRIITNYLYSSLDPAMLVDGTYSPERLTQDLSAQSRWLEILINTYLDVIIRANSAGWLESYDSEGSGMPSPPPNCGLLEFQGTTWEPHYQLQWQWVVIDYIAGALLLIASTISFWLRKKTLVPDIFGFVSSLTRDNPHFPVPVGGSTLDGIHRARALRSLKVKIADIGGPHEGYGRLGFVPVQPVVPAETLKKERKYV